MLKDITKSNFGVEALVKKPNLENTITDRAHLVEDIILFTIRGQSNEGLILKDLYTLKQQGRITLLLAAHLLYSFATNSQECSVF